jgi:alpha-tubulin suppressor-like RCC1 family protein
VRCWGLNDYGQVGGGTSGSNSPPTAVLGVRDGVQIAVAPTHACALGRSGSLTCWGSNVGGQMGDGSLGRGNLRLVPAVVSRLARSTQIMVALDATCGRTTDGKVICFGAGRLGPWELAGLQFATEVSLRSALSEYAERSPERPSGCAVMTNGALGCWGSALPGSHRGEQRSELPLQVRW